MVAKVESGSLNMGGDCWVRLMNSLDWGSLTLSVTRGRGRFHSSGLTFSSQDAEITGWILKLRGSLSS
jgi:hypothetical protein